MPSHSPFPAAPTQDVVRVCKLVGSSAPFSAVREAAAIIAARRSTLMLLGDTGTGKEMLARFVHDNSDRANAPFIPVDCSALTSGLFESELFGHVRGAFSGAIRDSLGFVRAAHGGTLFLDEIGELSLSLQAKLLRVLQERAVVPVGDSRARPVDIRVITATNRDLHKMVRAGTFREDLFHRLNVLVLNLPPLRERKEDILPLARHFLHKMATSYGEAEKSLAPQAAALLESYAWSGNVRELANVMEHAHVLAPGEIIDICDLPPRLRHTQAHSEGDGTLRLDEVERRAIAEALKRAKYCKAHAGRLLGIKPQRLNRRMSHLGIQLP